MHVFYLGAEVESLDQKDDGSVMQNLVWSARRRAAPPMSVEATLKQRDLRYGDRRSNAGKWPTWLLPLARKGISPAICCLFNVIIRSASSGNNFIPQTAIVNSIFPSVT